MKSARQTAFEILRKIESDKAYSSLSLNAALKQNSFADLRDASFITSLVYGVTERKLTLDYNLSLYLKSSVKKLHPAVLTALRLGSYQILFSEKVPNSAAVNESVKLVKDNSQAYSSGLVNAVLRKISSNGLVLPEKSDTYKFLSVKYSSPEELIKHFISSYGIENAEAHLEASLGSRPVFIRLNTIKCSFEELKNELNKENADIEKTELENCFILKNVGDITSLSAYIKGFFHVQDMSSQICASLLGVTPGKTLVDCCAAPGGKSFTAAQFMNNEGNIISCDMYEHKVSLINSGAKRLGINIISSVCKNASDLNKSIENADAVLCDVPCSGLGVIGRKPEIKYKSLSDFNSLPETQYAILSSCSKIVKNGGVLVYSTCTMNPAENEKVCERFLAEHTDFYLSRDERYLKFAKDGYMNIFASPLGGDGFFAARFERKAL
ncbi:MAG: 16S rRNA (cytosine(967)-C(5))-methyltransferase RsmB [Oscillospiraceae bacterium]|nr:16S rRNA (cytosine(967)-C(5))-methyltransferase RsmB [Oscillospiraceae bacterium]